MVFVHARISVQLKPLPVASNKKVHSTEVLHTYLSINKARYFVIGSEDCDTDGNSFLKACLNSNASFQCSAQAVFGQYIFWNHNCDFVWETTAHIDSLKWSGLMELKAAIR